MEVGRIAQLTLGPGVQIQVQIFCKQHCHWHRNISVTFLTSYLKKFHLAEASLTLVILYFNTQYITCMYYKDKTYLPTLYSLGATVQISCRLSLLCAQLHAAARRQCSPSQSAVCNYAVSLLQTLILQHPDPGLPLRIQMPG